MDLKTIDIERDRFNAALHALDLVHNSKLPINMVVDDILYRIFTLAIFSSHLAGRVALNLSHVCNHWRQRALSWPVLWGFYDLHHPQLSSLFLKRSANSSMTLIVSTKGYNSLFALRPRMFSSSDWQSRLRIIMGLLPRVKSLVMHVDSTDSELILDMFKTNASNIRLHSLDLGLYTSSWHPGDVIEQQGKLLPDKIFNVHGTLRSLALREVMVNWDRPPIANLTRLALTRPGTPPTINQLVDLLETCPLLEDLDLHILNQVDVATLNAQVSKKIVPLPQLTRLRYYAENVNSSHYFSVLSSHIRISRITALYLDYSSFETLTPESTLCVLQILPQNALSYFVSITHLHLDLYRAAGTFVLGGRFCSTGSSLSKSLSVMDRVYETGFVIRGADTTGSVTFFLQAMKTFRSVRRLELTADGWQFLTSWGVDVPTTFPELTILELSGYDRPPRKSSEALQSLVFPHVIHLRKLVLQTLEVDGEVLKRIVTDIRIAEVYLYECSGVEEEDVRALRASGVIVHWSVDSTMGPRLGRAPSWALLAGF
ncbi:hypothetical protein BU17DRAFT_94887 [Hysterangium stoloniferum]|nr:hypothetical protein BU17DRAFT_94887 [Hysterangium stoloniferum]